MHSGFPDVLTRLVGRRGEPNPVGVVLWRMTLMLAGENSDLLTALQLQVARRADEIARGSASPTPLNLECWLRAEDEVLCAATLDGAPRAQA